jgi:succinoglycan biosynthesis transport protein ExoP
VAEAYRMMRANLEFADIDKSLNTILITSGDTDEGKSSVSANLAAILAQGGKKVTLLDADLRKPGIHEIIALPNKSGLSNVIRNEIDVPQVRQVLEEENVSVITSGAAPPNPSELLSSKRMEKILNELKQDSDVVILDSPPFVVSDSLMLAAKVDGVVLVVRYGFTRRKMFRSIIDQLDRAGARVVGVVMNRVPQRNGYYGAYQYKTAYYSDNHSGETEELETAEQKPFRQKIGAFVSKNWARLTSLSLLSR